MLAGIKFYCQLVVYLPSLGKSHPEDEDELEEVVECYAIVRVDRSHFMEGVQRTEPVSGANGTLDDSEEGEHNPVLQVD